MAPATKTNLQGKNDSDRVERLYQTVARKIAEMVAQNRHEPGWRLPSERELSEQLGVSRPVVREAVIALEVKGMVEVRRSQGIVVLPEPPHTMNFIGLGADIGPGPFELLEARLSIEANAAALAAERMPAKAMVELESYIDQMHRENDVLLLNENGDRSFHMLIARSSGNAVIASLVEALWQQRDNSIMWRKLHEHIHAPSIRPLWIGDHYAILSALRLRNAEAAKRAMERHIKNVMNELLEASENGQVEVVETQIIGRQGHSKLKGEGTK